MCYTDSVAAPRKQNLTLTLDEQLLLEARKIALDRRTSVNQMVRDYLYGLVAEADRRKIARARLSELFDRGLVEVGERTWTRDELYER